jgi:hypothetical protein
MAVYPASLAVYPTSYFAPASSYVWCLVFGIKDKKKNDATSRI